MAGRCSGRAVVDGALVRACQSRPTQLEWNAGCTGGGSIQLNRDTIFTDAKKGEGRKDGVGEEEEGALSLPRLLCRLQSVSVNDFFSIQGRGGSSTSAYEKSKCGECHRTGPRRPLPPLGMESLLWFCTGGLPMTGSIAPRVETEMPESIQEKKRQVHLCVFAYLCDMCVCVCISVHIVCWGEPGKKAKGGADRRDTVQGWRSCQRGMPRRWDHYEQQSVLTSDS
ncbi:hypothetical protein LZ30DRAFT_398443 [Colletotrichum cereale]|nr:hypothetical protein LZ30DRAFT_398443 [Colletotrichum cereale]